jgi:threonine synthase
VDSYYAEGAARGRVAKTIASAIEIGRPVNLSKALRSLEWMNGVVRQATDAEILDGKALVGLHGYGCEPASGASVAGLRRLLNEKMISLSDRVVCILTGHGLKDPDLTVSYHSPAPGAPVGEHANPPVRCAADIDAIAAVLGPGVP